MLHDDNRRVVCPICESCELCFVTLYLARCTRCKGTVSRSFFATLRQIRALPEAHGGQNTTQIRS